MSRDEIMLLANETAGQHWMDEAHIQRFAALVVAAERERIKKINAPVIQRINEHIDILRARGGT
jgi:hypothetical protein